MRIAIVTDSTADLPPELIKQYNIHVIPNIIVIGNQSLRDGIDISREEFYNRLPTLQPSPTTATASSGEYEQLYGRLFDQGAEQILSIHAAGKLSGIMNAASGAAGQFNNKVHVIDSEMVTLGLGFQVLSAAEALTEGKSLEEVLQLLQEIRQRVWVIAMLDTLEYVRRSGRVSWARARLGELLNIKPFIELRFSKVSSIGETRTRRKGIERLKELLKGFDSIERLAILHTNAEQEARQFLEDIRQDINLPALIVNVTTVIGVHVGPNGLGFAVVVK